MQPNSLRLLARDFKKFLKDIGLSEKFLNKTHIGQLISIVVKLFRSSYLFLENEISLPSVSLWSLTSEYKSHQVYRESKHMLRTVFPGKDEAVDHEFDYLIDTGVYELYFLTRSDLPEGNLVAGVVVLMNYSLNSLPVAHLEYICINPCCRSGGFGTLLLQLTSKCLTKRALEEDLEVSPKCAQLLTLECEPRLVPFYEKRLKAVDSQIKPYQWESNGTGSKEEFHWMVHWILPHLYFVGVSKDWYYSLRSAYVENWEILEESCSESSSSSDDDNDSV